MEDDRRGAPDIVAGGERRSFPSAGEGSQPLVIASTFLLPSTFLPSCFPSFGLFARNNFFLPAALGADRHTPSFGRLVSVLARSLAHYQLPFRSTIIGILITLVPASSAPVSKRIINGRFTAPQIDQEQLRILPTDLIRPPSPAKQASISRPKSQQLQLRYMQRQNSSIVHR